MASSRRHNGAADHDNVRDVAFVCIASSFEPPPERAKHSVTSNVGTSGDQSAAPTQYREAGAATAPQGCQDKATLRCDGGCGDDTARRGRG